MHTTHSNQLSQTIEIQNRWDEAKASQLSEPELLLYRSNLLGADKRVTNFGGGNTSAKVKMKDPLTGQMVDVLWVKGSGGDLGTMKLDGLATLYMDKILALPPLFKGPADEDMIVGMYPHCTFNLNPRAPSIDTPLHGLVDKPHVDHMHPDAVIAIAASKDSRMLTEEIWGGEIGWLPWIRPGFELGLRLQKFALRILGQGRDSGSPWHVHLGRHRQTVLRDHIVGDQSRHQLAGQKKCRRTRPWQAAGGATVAGASA